MLVAGLYMIISGKAGLGGERSLKGAKARIAGLILVAPILLTLCFIPFGIILNETALDFALATLNSIWYAAMMIAPAYINFHTVSRETKARGGCLTIWLGITLLSGIMTLYMTLQIYPSAPAWMFVASGVIAVLQAISITAIWMWKKWGVSGLIASVVVNWILTLVQGGTILGVIISAFSFTVTFYLLIKPKWHFFDSETTVPESKVQESALRDEY